MAVMQSTGMRMNQASRQKGQLARWPEGRKDQDLKLLKATAYIAGLSLSGQGKLKR